MKNLIITIIAVLVAQASFACSASFTYTVGAINNNLLNFNIHNTSSPGTLPSGYHAQSTVYFGDGTSSQVVTNGYWNHNYSATGTYTVKLVLEIVDTFGTTVYCADSTSQSVIINYTTACASSWAAVAGSTPGSITFTATNPGGATGLSYFWSFGDGSTGWGNPITHTYAANGSYSVSMTDSNNTCYYSNQGAITVTNQSVCAGVSASFYSSVSGNVASFSNTSTGPLGYAYSQSNWYFGDGGTSTAYSPSHTYATGGTYTVGYRITWIDTPSNTVICTDSTTQTISVGSSSSSCAGAHAYFSSSTSGLTASFTNSSTYAGFSASPVASWYFGDGAISSSYSPSHTYASAGTYTVSLQMTWLDTLTLTSCWDSVSHNVTVSSGSSINGITGNIFVDTSVSGNPTNPIFKVWLIAFDSATSTLSAVDSTTVLGSYWTGAYTFYNEPAGSYRVKAALTNGPTSGTAAVPTYGFDSLYWYGATVINYSGSGISSGNNIFMQNGTVTSGPGFIGGNVGMGANKGTQNTGIPVANLTIFLENMNGKPLAYTTTDANGNYHFSNFPTGTYQVYPEGLGYLTTPAVVVAGATQITNTNFIEHTISKTITPVSEGVVNVTVNTSSFNIFPNPGNGIFNIAWSSNKTIQTVNATITDIAGRKVFETNLNMNNSIGKTRLNLSQLKPGMYFINITGENVNYTNKIVLQY